MQIVAAFFHQQKEGKLLTRRVYAMAFFVGYLNVSLKQDIWTKQKWQLNSID